MNEQIKKIKSELERRMKGGCGSHYEYTAYQSILSFIDSLEDEPDCAWYNNGECKKGLPGTKCEVVGCVAKTPSALQSRREKDAIDEGFTKFMEKGSKAKDCKESKNIGKTCQNFTKPSDDELKIVEDSAHLGPSCTADENGVRIESHPIGPDNFRSEVVRFCNEHFDELHSDMETIDIVHIIAHHFAEWQKKQDQETIELAEDHAMLAGRMQMKEEIGRRIDEELSENDAWKAVSPDDRFFGGYGIALENIKDKIESL